MNSGPYRSQPMQKTITLSEADIKRAIIAYVMNNSLFDDEPTSDKVSIRQGGDEVTATVTDTIPDF